MKQNNIEVFLLNIVYINSFSGIFSVLLNTEIFPMSKTDKICRSTFLVTMTGKLVDILVDFHTKMEKAGGMDPFLNS